MKTKNETRLPRADFWASCAIMFGVGYMVLSQVRYGILVALAVALFGALVKLIIHSRLDRLYRETQPTSSDSSH